jgi:sn-glycerol 3-phosphate transport system permease protein
MVENRPWATFVSHAILVAGIFVVAFPLYITFVASTLSLEEILAVPMPVTPGTHFWENYAQVLTAGSTHGASAPVGRMMFNSLMMALIIAFGKIAISIIASFAVVYFRFPLRRTFFWMIFITLMLPVEVRIIPTYAVMADFHLINTFTGLTVPLIASATATLLFRQVFLTVPDELVEAARMDGAGPWRFLRDILVPVSGANIAALFVILFVYGWNQYLWPLLVATDPKLDTIVIGIVKMIGVESQTEWNRVMATAVLALLPPVAVVVLMQRWFVKGLTEGEK